jgi:hypothetical protein
MSIQLTDDQSKAIEQARGTPPSVIDPRTHKTYVLVSMDAFERLTALVGQAGHEEFSPALRSLAREQFTQEDLERCLRDLDDPSGLELKDFVSELERMVDQP